MRNERSIGEVWRDEVGEHVEWYEQFESQQQINTLMLMQNSRGGATSIC